MSGGGGCGGTEPSLDDEGQKTASHEAKAEQKSFSLEARTEKPYHILFRVEKRKGMTLTSLEM